MRTKKERDEIEKMARRKTILFFSVFGVVTVSFFTLIYFIIKNL
jgi:hypothetical protein